MEQKSKLFFRKKLLFDSSFYGTDRKKRFSYFMSMRDFIQLLFKKLNIIRFENFQDKQQK